MANKIVVKRTKNGFEIFSTVYNFNEGEKRRLTAFNVNLFNASDFNEVAIDDYGKYSLGIHEPLRVGKCPIDITRVKRAYTRFNEWAKIMKKALASIQVELVVQDYEKPTLNTSLAIKKMILSTKTAYVVTVAIILYVYREQVKASLLALKDKVMEVVKRETKQ